jgi:hypothetical protein
MTETAKALSTQEVSNLIGSHIAAYLDGGPDREKEDVELAQGAGLKVERTIARWADAREYLLFILPDAQPRVEETTKPQPDASEVEVTSVDSPAAKVVRVTDSWKRKSWGQEQTEERVQDDERPSASKPRPIGKLAAPSLLDRPVNEVRPPYSRPIPEAPVAPPNAGIDRLTYPRGLLGHATQYVQDTAALPNRWLSLATATSALAKALDRKVLGPTGNSVILWMLLIAETGAGKQHALNCIRMLLRAMSAETAIVASGLGSVQGIEEILEGTTKFDPNPSPLVVIDEVGGWLSRISSKGQTGNVSEMPGTLQSLWGWPPQLEWLGSKTKGKEMKPVHGPAFAIFGASTEKKLIRALTKDQVENGFVNRMLFVNVGRGALERIEPKHEWSRFPKWLGDALKGVAGEPAPEGPMRLEMNVGGTTSVLRDFRRIEWGSGTKELWMKFEKDIRGMPSIEDRELWIRAPEQALRLATVVAVYRRSALVEVEDWQWAEEVVKHSMHQLVQAMHRNLSEDLDQADLVDRVRTEFQKKGQLTQGAIRKLCERKTKDHRKIDQVIDHLVKCGDIVEVNREGKVGFPTRKWQWQG